MPLTMGTISGAFVRPDLGIGAMAVHIEAATDGTRMTYSGNVLAGSYKVRLGSDGTAVATIPLVPQAGLLPADARWRLVMSVGFLQVYKKEFTLAGDVTWGSLVDVSGVPITVSIQAAATAAAAAAAASATAAAASASAAAGSAASASAIADPSGGYFHTVGNSNGTSDVAAINGLLAASPKYLRTTLGQTYLLDGALVVKPGTTFDTRGSILQHKAGYAGNTINNTAVSTVQRTISVTI
jgi:hypothetical protein